MSKKRIRKCATKMVRICCLIQRLTKYIVVSNNTHGLNVKKLKLKCSFRIEKAVTTIRFCRVSYLCNKIVNF